MCCTYRLAGLELRQTTCCSHKAGSQLSGSWPHTALTGEQGDGREPVRGDTEQGSERGHMEQGRREQGRRERARRERARNPDRKRTGRCSCSRRCRCIR